MKGLAEKKKVQSYFQGFLYKHLKAKSSSRPFKLLISVKMKASEEYHINKPGGKLILPNRRLLDSYFQPTVDHDPKAETSAELVYDFS